MQFDLKRIAIQYYFGDLQYWKLPRIAADALEQGHDGPGLRALAGIANPIAADMDRNLIDCAFREMGVDAPISKNHARLVLAAESVSRALNGTSNIFDEAAHIRIHLCEINEPPEELRRIFDLAQNAQHNPRSSWGQLEQALMRAFKEFQDSFELSK